MTEEEFRKLYMDDAHMELKVSDVLHKGSFDKSNLATYSPGDKNITSQGKIPGKSLIESKEMEKRRIGVEHMVFDAISVKAPEVLDVPVATLIALAIKMAPQKADVKIEHEFTLAEFVKKAYDNKDEVIDIEPNEKA
jgi:hypothetical protein